MKENPYVEFMKLFEKEKTDPVKIGTVISSNPMLRIKVGEIQLSNENLWISHCLIDSGLYENDTVALFEFNNGQMYLVVAKVVKL